MALPTYLIKTSAHSLQVRVGLQESCFINPKYLSCRYETVQRFFFDDILDPTNNTSFECLTKILLYVGLRAHFFFLLWSHFRQAEYLFHFHASNLGSARWWVWTPGFINVPKKPLMGVFYLTGNSASDFHAARKFSVFCHPGRLDFVGVIRNARNTNLCCFWY